MSSIPDRNLSSKFPECIFQGLQKLEEMNKVPTSAQMHKLQSQIVDENIFCSQDSIGKRKGLSPVEELVIVRCIAQHLSKVFDPGKRNYLFITLFPALNSEIQAPFKVRALSSLVSLAVVTHNVAVLDASAVWMQQVNCFGTWCSRVSASLIQDFFGSRSEPPQHIEKALKSLPGATPLFAANLMTSMSQVFAKVGRNEICDEPPLNLHRTVIGWLRSEPQLILTPLTTPLPGISLPMTAVLAIAPLSKWCVEAPFFASSRSDPECADAYTELHLLILQALQNVVSLQAKLTQREVLCAEHVKSISDALLVRLNAQETAEPSAKETALNRLAQITLVSYHSNCLSGRTSEMWSSLKKLPQETRLMTTLLKYS